MRPEGKLGSRVTVNLPLPIHLLQNLAGISIKPNRPTNRYIELTPCLSSFYDDPTAQVVYKPLEPTGT
jgi:hypothetical protein